MLWVRFLTAPRERLFLVEGCHRVIYLLQRLCYVSCGRWKYYFSLAGCLEQSLPVTTFPCLYSFAKNKEISVQSFLNNMSMEDTFHTPLSLQAAQEYNIFSEIIDQMMASREEMDRWIYPWGNSKFSSLKFYKLNFGSIEPPPFMWIWQSKVCKKINFFVWLVFRDRINSKNLLKRKGFLNAASDLRCVLCDSNCEETTFHLLFEWPFSLECWQYVGIQWNLELDFFIMFEDAKNAFDRRFFMEIVVVVTWTIWKQRNDFIFRNLVPSFSSRRICFNDMLKLQMSRFSPALNFQVSLWLNSR